MADLGVDEMRYYKNGNHVMATLGILNLPEITAEEYKAEMAAVNKRMEVQASIAEAHRPFTSDEVTAMLITAQINTLTVDDNTALRMKQFYPEWAENTAYTVGYKVRYGDNLWRCRSAHTSIKTWEPSTATASMWETINETHSGTVDDPIPYNGNMALESGKHYMQNYEIYLCNRDTVITVYNALPELVGLYVEVAV